MDLEQKVAIVTGAGIGLGKAIAIKLAAQGARLALWDMNYASVEKLAAELDPQGKNAAGFQVDVTKESEVVAAVQATVAKFGCVDILVNNAGITRHKSLEETTVELFEQVIGVNLVGLFICCKAVAPLMKSRKYGKIVNIASLAARTGRPGVGVNYAASKGGVLGVTKCLAKELGQDNIYVNAICPGPILTDQTRQYSREVFDSWNAGRAIPKDGYPEDVGDAVVFLASSKSDWITGVTLDVNGGIFIG